ncbi:MAG: hypothetical protein ABEH66_06020 [Halobacteriales archaeon]
MTGLLADPLLAGLTAARLAVVVLGAVVAARGVRGYRLTGNRLMLALGVAFALVTVDPVVTAAAGAVLDGRTTGFVSQATTLALYGTAFSLVLVALYWGPDSQSSQRDA